MNKMLSFEEKQIVRSVYQEGAVVELDYMNDPQAPPSGTRGKVLCVDSLGSICVEWDNGSTLNLIPKVDRFHLVKEEGGR